MARIETFRKNYAEYVHYRDSVKLYNLIMTDNLRLVYYTSHIVSHKNMHVDLRCYYPSRHEGVSHHAKSGYQKTGATTASLVI